MREDERQGEVEQLPVKHTPERVRHARVLGDREEEYAEQDHNHEEVQPRPAEKLQDIADLGVPLVGRDISAVRVGNRAGQDALYLFVVVGRRGLVVQREPDDDLAREPRADRLVEYLHDVRHVLNETSGEENEHAAEHGRRVRDVSLQQHREPHQPKADDCRHVRADTLDDARHRAVLVIANASVLVFSVRGDILVNKLDEQHDEEAADDDEICGGILRASVVLAVYACSSQFTTTTCTSE